MLKRILVLTLCAALPAATLAGGYGGYGGGRYWGGHYHQRHHSSGDAGTLLAGLVVGGLFGYFISEDRRHRRAYSTYRYDHGPYHRSRTRYYDHYGVRGYGYRAPAYREYMPVRPTPRRVVVRKNTDFPGHDCRMTREYTTTIEIDGLQRDAYGTRCLTADGAWVLGPPKLVPEFAQR